MSFVSVEKSHTKNADGAVVDIIDKAGSDVTTTANTMDATSSHNIYYDYNPKYRWVVLITCFLCSVFIGPPFMNWPPLQQMVDGDGAYSSLCEGDPDATWSNGVIFCEAKRVECGKLGGFCVGVMFAFSFVAGISLDCLGGKLTSLFGLASVILGWILLAFSSPSFHAYKPSLFFIAAGTDPAFFGLLSSANLFPGHSSTVMSCFGAARSISFAIPLVMRQIWNGSTVTLKGVALCFLPVLAFWVVIIAIWLPFQPYPRFHGEVFDNTPGEGKIGISQDVRRKPHMSWKGFLSGSKTQVTDFWFYARSWGYLALMPIPICQFIRNSYYSMSYLEHIPNAESYYTIMNPLSMIPCPFLGFIADRWSATLVIFILSISGAVSLAFAMIDVIAFEYMSVTVNWLFISFIASQFYVYVAAVYPQKHMGKLVGFCLLLGGLVSLASSAMYDTAANGSMVAMDIVVLLLGGFAALLCVYLYLGVERPVQRKAKEARRKVKEAGDASRTEDPSALY